MLCILDLSHPKCTYTAVNTHTHTAVNTHTVNTHPEQWAAIYAAAPGEQLGVRCLAQGHLSRGIEGGESAVHSLPPPTIPAGRDSNSQPLDYESDSLTIRPQLPPFTCNLSSILMKACVLKHAGKMKSIIMLVSSTFWLFWLLHSVSVAGITLKYIYYLPLSLHTYISIKNRVKNSLFNCKGGKQPQKNFFPQETLTKIISEKKKIIIII